MKEEIVFNCATRLSASYLTWGSPGRKRKGQAGACGLWDQTAEQRVILHSASQCLVFRVCCRQVVWCGFRINRESQQMVQWVKT